MREWKKRRHSAWGTWEWGQWQEHVNTGWPLLQQVDNELQCARTALRKKETLLIQAIHVATMTMRGMPPAPWRTREAASTAAKDLMVVAKVAAETHLTGSLNVASGQFNDVRREVCVYTSHTAVCVSSYYKECQSTLGHMQIITRALRLSVCLTPSLSLLAAAYRAKRQQRSSKP